MVSNFAPESQSFLTVAETRMLTNICVIKLIPFNLYNSCEGKVFLVLFLHRKKLKVRRKWTWISSSDNERQKQDLHLGLLIQWRRHFLLIISWVDERMHGSMLKTYKSKVLWKRWPPVLCPYSPWHLCHLLLHLQGNSWSDSDRSLQMEETGYNFYFCILELLKQLVL